MATIDLTKKYSNFFAPRTQIYVNQEDIQEKYGVTTSFVTVEEEADSKSKFSFFINDPQCAWIKTGLFELKKTVQVRMGYANTLEPVATGEITSVKSIFPSNGSPQIEIAGQANDTIDIALSQNDSPIYPLCYGKTLYSFTALTTATEQNGTRKILATQTPTSNLKCTAECVGLPDIKVGSNVSLTGLAPKFNQTYIVEKALHSMDNSLNFRTKFDAQMQLEKALFQPKIGRVF
jgi:phage protein D